MSIYKLKFTRLQLEIFRLFCIKTGIVLNQREIAGFLSVSPTAVAKALPALEKECIVIITKGKTNLNKVEFNRESQTALELKRAENFKLIIESGLAEFLEEKFPEATIIIFGSYASGDDTYKSDIDIAIVGCKSTKVSIETYEKTLEKEIRLNFYSTLKGIDRYLRSNIIKGIVLSGGVEA